MDTIKNAANSASESIQGTGAAASKEANKNQAEDSSKGIGERAAAAKDAAGDKVDETSHSAKS